ncbi:hypothetical protein BD779DRAFT_938275 [Infundibulicybe gibba]|nr:hypothetical protein BD779DRAFT_938275 [Infundibulicybe gibba]
MFLPLAFVVGLGLNSATIVRAQVFALACDQYPDVCDNYSNGVLCHGIGTTLHYDANSGTTGNGDRRRTAVGCGSPNFCSGSGLQCDEYPYASTYDGGLGCFPAGFTGPSTELIQSGSTHCRWCSEWPSRASPSAILPDSVEQPEQQIFWYVLL